MSVEMKFDSDSESIHLLFGTSYFALYHIRSSRFIAYADSSELLISHIRFHGSGVAIKRFKDLVRQWTATTRIKEHEVDQNDVTDRIAEKFFHQLVLAGGPVRKIEEAIQINKDAVRKGEQPIFSDSEINYYRNTRDFFQAFTHSVNGYEIKTQRKNAEDMFKKATETQKTRAQKTEK